MSVFNLEILKKIGSAIGPVLRIDSYTTSGSRGSYARLCVQVDLKRSFINIVRIGRLKQKVMYEGIGSLCFCYGRLRHKQENCCYQIRPKKEEELVDGEPSSMPKVS